MRDFRGYRVWQRAMELVVKIYALTRLLPSEEKYSLARQMQRAAVSIASNIAEGCSRSSDADFKRFVEMSPGSAFELETQSILSDRIYSTSKHDLYSESMALLNHVQAELNALRNTLLG